MAGKDYYKILDLSNDASTDEIKKAYRKLAMQYHPDLNRGREEWANDKFKEINEAFSVLGDPKKRRQYDRSDPAGNIGDVFGSQGTRTTFGDLVNDFDGAGPGFGFLDNIFDDHLRGTGFAFQKFRRGFHGLKGARFGTQESIDLEDLFERARSPEMSSVNYEIVLSKEQAFTGTEKELFRNGKRLKVKIPAGVQFGGTIRLRNALATTDGRPGDIVISVRVK